MAILFVVWEKSGFSVVLAADTGSVRFVSFSRWLVAEELLSSAPDGCMMPNTRFARMGLQELR